MKGKMYKIICWLKGHTRDEKRTYIKKKYWHIKCKRCGYKISYLSPRVRLVGLEIRFGFTGE